MEKNKTKKKKIKKTKKAIPTKEKRKKMMVMGIGGNKVVEKLKSGKNNELISIETPSKTVDPLK